MVFASDTDGGHTLLTGEYSRSQKLADSSLGLYAASARSCLKSSGAQRMAKFDSKFSVISSLIKKIDLDHDSIVTVGQIISKFLKKRLYLYDLVFLVEVFAEFYGSYFFQFIDILEDLHSYLTIKV